MAILLIGAEGLVGQAVLRQHQRFDDLPPLRALGRGSCDITDAASIARAIEGASIAINCAAATNVDWCEDNPDAAYAVNGAGPGLLAQACRARGVALIHISTDYVFDGTKGGAPYVETDPVNPICVYAKSKLMGEERIQDSGTDALIIRTAWLFGPNPKNIFPILRREAMKRRDDPTVPDMMMGNDHIGSPTPADALAELLILAAARIHTGDPAPWGIYHYAGEPAATRYDMAHLAFLHYGVAHRLHGQPTPVRKAVRPRASPLDSSKAARSFGLLAPSWTAAWMAGLEDLDHAEGLA